MAIKTPTNIGEIKPKTQTAVAKSGMKTVTDYLNGEAFKSQLSMALPQHLNTEHFLRSAISEFRLNPSLQECSVPSVLGYFLQAAATGLEPASTLGQCYPVPFYNKNTNCKEVQFIISYRGMLTLARNSGDVQTVRAHTVHEKDEFHIEYGLHEDIIHKPYIDGDAGAFKGAYVIVTFKDGTNQALFMPKSEIDAHKARSKTGNSNFSPWATDYEAMALKTVFRTIFKWLPISIDKMANDEAVVRAKSDASNAQDFSEMVETEFVANNPDYYGEDVTDEVPATSTATVNNAENNSL